MKHLLLLAICCLLLSGCIPALVTQAPGAYGHVTDARTHAAIGGAMVSFPEGPTARTDKDGRYDLPHTNKLGIIFFVPWEFQTLPLQVSHPGYRTAAAQVFTIAKHQRKDIDLQAQP